MKFLLENWKRYVASGIIFISFISIVFSTACDDTITGDDLDKIIIPSSDVSYAEYIQPVFNSKCATSYCHDDQSRADGYSMTTWSNVLQAGIVNPGSPETSRLAWRIEGLGVPLMPPVNSTIRPLTDNQIDGIKIWIKEGAKNN